jgi:hypothetical protein
MRRETQRKLNRTTGRKNHILSRESKQAHREEKTNYKKEYCREIIIEEYESLGMHFSNVKRGEANGIESITFCVG